MTSGHGSIFNIYVPLPFYTLALLQLFVLELSHFSAKLVTEMKLPSLKSGKVLSIFGLIVAAVLTINSFTTDRKDDMQTSRRRLLLSPAENDELVTKVIPMNQRMPAEKIRYAAFGTSIAWGTRLENRREDAFIWQLSPTASNFAIRATGAEFPAKCLSSMIGDEVYDVIVIEFTMRIDASAFALVQRLRQRFPDAIIINFMNWTPQMITPNTMVNTHIRSLAEKRGFSKSYVHDPNFHQLMKEEVGIDDWMMDWGEAVQINDRMKHELGVISTTFYMSNGDPIQWLAEQSSRFSEDSFHLSASGHKDTAEHIREIISQVGVLANPRVNDFEMKDDCHNWFESGVVDDKAVKFSPSGYLHPLPTNNLKHALSFEHGEGWLTVNNRADHEQDLYISYLTTSPAPSFYPQTAVSISSTNYEQEVVLDPTPSRDWGDRFVHLPREVYIGKIDPGESTLYFRTLEEGTMSPFSLVSFVVTSFKA